MGTHCTHDWHACPCVPPASASRPQNKEKIENVALAQLEDVFFVILSTESWPWLVSHRQTLQQY
jgi:hypothetical protein